MIGRTLSHFRITAKLGEGGMGEVYRAEDTKLGREVAIKVLPAAVASDPERLARFEREAKVLASLNHPNIAAIYGLEEDDGVQALVLELVEGPTLAERLARGPIPVGEALDIALQIAEALEAAHGRGIVHRDLKPANVKVNRDGEVKVLDFGLAKPLALSADEGGRDLSTASTWSHPSTQEGVLVGTVAYMSPEQARGGQVDTRSDIWSFGAVLWEMLAGTPLFGGATASDTLAAVLRERPNWEALPEATHPAIHRLLRRCLDRDPVRRLQHVGDARLELYEARESSHDPADAVDSWPARRGVDATWTLTTEVCRHLDRRSLDPGIIGDHLIYRDNRRSSDVLVIYLPGLGGGHSNFEEVLERSSFRGVAVTLYGMQPQSDRRIPLPIADHLTILRLFLQHLKDSIQPAVIILVGFSSGADLTLRLISEGGVGRESVDGILALSPNINLETCFFSRRVASIPEHAAGEMFRVAREIAAELETVEEWLNTTTYLVEVVRKFNTDLEALRRHARDIVTPFEEGPPWPLAGWYRDAKRAGIAPSLVFASAESEQAPLRDLMLAHVDHQVLGSDFDDAEFVTEPDSQHFDLMGPQVIEKNLFKLLVRLGSSGRSSTG